VRQPEEVKFVRCRKKREEEIKSDLCLVLFKTGKVESCSRERMRAAATHSFFFVCLQGVCEACSEEEAEGDLWRQRRKGSRILEKERER